MMPSPLPQSAFLSDAILYDGGEGLCRWHSHELEAVRVIPDSLDDAIRTALREKVQGVNGFHVHAKLLAHINSQPHELLCEDPH